MWGGEEEDALARDSKAREQQLFDSSFRDAIDQGKQECAQSGFNSGFTAGMLVGEKVGAVQGSLETLRVFTGQVAGTSQLVADVRNAV